MDKFAKIISIEEIPEEESYELTVADNHNFFCNGMLKHNCGLEIKYRNGKLVEAVTRGSGFEGDIITENIKKIPSIPQELIVPFDCSIRGEVLMRHTVFNEKYSDKMKNCRNAAAGIMKHLDGAELENLNFVAYDMQEVGEKAIKKEIEKLDYLISNGFEVPEYQHIKTVEDALRFRTGQYENRENIEFDIDGVVVKPEVIDYEDLRNRTPKNSCAIKFELDVAVSTIIDIKWSQTGKHFTPIAVVEPVDLCGTTVQRASLSNTDWMIKHGVEIGKKCKIVKRGEIIPYIEKCF